MLKSRYEMIQSKRRKPHRKESIHKKEEEKVGKEWATTLQFFLGNEREKIKKVGKRRLGFFHPNTKLILVLMVIFKGSNNSKWVWLNNEIAKAKLKGYW